MQEFNNFVKSNALKDPNKIEKSSLKNFGEDDGWDIRDEDIKLMNFSSYSQMFNLGSDITKKASNFRNEFNKLLQEDLSLDEFKNKYMDFKQRHDEFVKEFEIAMGDKMLLVNNNDNTNNKKSVVKNDDDYFNSVIKNLISLKKPKKNKDIMDLLM